MPQELRTGQGMEFLTGFKEAYCNQNGVLHENMAGNTSQRNGLRERCWWTTMDRTQAALTKRGIPEGY